MQSEGAVTKAAVAKAVVIGAGVVGAAVAREMTKYRLRVTLIDSEYDLATGATGGCGGVIHAGFDPEPGTLKAELNVRGNAMYEGLTRALGFRFKRCGTLILALREEDIPGLERLERKADLNGVVFERWPRDKVLNEEPNVTPAVVAAGYAPTAGVVFPQEVTFTLAASAILNGAVLRLECPARGLLVERDVVRGVRTGNGLIPADIVVNAAGIEGAAVAGMVGDKSFRIKPRKGQQVILDRRFGGFVKRHLMTLPTEKGKGIGIAPAAEGNLHLGSTAEEGVDPRDTATTAEGVDWIFENARLLAPAVERAWMISAYAGVRAISDTNDFIIGESPVAKGLFHVAGIQSPGLTAAPAIAERVLEVIGRSGFTLPEREEFEPGLEPRLRAAEMDNLQWDALIARDPRWGRIVCRCEMVTEAEVAGSIHRQPGAGTVEGVKRRTRAGMGRCQGGFCGTRVLSILARELGIDPWEVQRTGRGSHVAIGPSKCIFEQKESGLKETGPVETGDPEC